MIDLRSLHHFAVHVDEFQRERVSRVSRWGTCYRRQTISSALNVVWRVFIYCDKRVFERLKAFNHVCCRFSLRFYLTKLEHVTV